MSVFEDDRESTRGFSEYLNQTFLGVPECPVLGRSFAWVEEKHGSARSVRARIHPEALPEPRAQDGREVRDWLIKTVRSMFRGRGVVGGSEGELKVVSVHQRVRLGFPERFFVLLVPVGDWRSDTQHPWQYCQDTGR